jgi:circadian clock protein KaiB
LPESGEIDVPSNNMSSDWGSSQMAAKSDEVRLRLFVSGASPRSLRAVAAIRKLCEARLAGRYCLEVVDVFRNPEAARAQGVVALPTLLLLAPAPKRLFIGDMSDIAPIAACLGLTD